MHTKQGMLENIILNALWNLEENGSEIIVVSNIMEKVNSKNQKWAYTTIKTVLDRLADKDVLERIKVKRKYCYKSKISRVKAGRDAILRITSQYYTGNLEEMIKAAEKLKKEVYATA
jgi:predicted transcriptional regulator